MYCNKCHTIIPNDEIKCPKCGYINEKEELDITKEIDLNNVINNKKKTKIIIHYCGVIILIVLLIISGIYILKDSNSLNDNTKPTTQAKESLKFNETFHFNNIEIKYNKDKYGTSKNTIFNKKDNTYNIELNIIKQSEYDKYINEYKTSDTKLGHIKTKSFVLNTNTAYIFISKEEYYLLRINSNDLSSTLEHLKLSNELTQISNSIKEK